LTVLVEGLRARSAGHAEALADPSRLRVAVNQEFTGWESAAQPGDEVAIFPPVTGG
jgi:sulfur-carrier protein